MAGLGEDPGGWSAERRVEVLSELEALRGWLDARETALLAVIGENTDHYDHGCRDVAGLVKQVARVSHGHAKARAGRAVWCQRYPQLIDALAVGALPVAHVDAICALGERLQPDDLARLDTDIDGLMGEIAELTAAQASTYLKRYETSILADDGVRDLDAERARNSTRLTKNSDGTYSLVAQLDRISGHKLRNCLDAKLTEIWRRNKNLDPHIAPPKEVLHNQALRTQALIELVSTGATADPAIGEGTTQVLVLIDYQTLLGQLSLHQNVRLSDGSPIPAGVARQMACEAGILPVVLGGASLPLDVGRTQRLATPAQRIALQATHDSCVIKGCDIAFAHCQIHHIQPWTNNGPTDLANLAPLCAQHHHMIHNHHWHLTLNPQHQGTLHKHPPPTNQGAGSSRPGKPARRPRARTPRTSPPNRKPPGPTGKTNTGEPPDAQRPRQIPAPNHHRTPMPAIRNLADPTDQATHPKKSEPRPPNPVNHPTESPPTVPIQR